MARHLRLRNFFAFVIALNALTLPAWAATPAQVLASEGPAPHPLSAWIAVPIGITLFLLAVYACSRLVHNNVESDRQFHAESGDRPVTPVPGDDGNHHFFH